MSYRDKIKKNTPKVELHSIMSLVAGGWKTGKTRLWKEVTELHYNSPDEFLLIGFESGYETWELENIIPIHEEGSDKDLWKVWEVFKKEIVPDLVKEAKEGRIVKLIGIDTVDRCIDACTAWVLRDRARKYGATNIDSIQEITEVSKGVENGWTFLHEELKKPFDALKNAGYGVMGLAWTKEKETTLYNGLKYNSIELMMHGTGKKVFESQASLICCLYNEIIVKDKQGNTLEDNIRDKKDKEKASNFHETKTVMIFRPTEHVSIAGGRYTNLPEKVDYSAENFLQVFKEAVEGQLKKTNKSIDELKEVENKEREQKAKEFAEHQEEEEQKLIPKEYHEQLSEVVLPLMKDENKKKKIMSEFKKIFNSDKADYNLIQDVEMLDAALTYAKTLV